MLTASIVIGVFLIFAVIAVIINKNGNDDEKNTTAKVAVVKDETDGSTDISTIDDGDETETAAMQDETTKEEETERETVNPKTLPYKIRVNRAANVITIYANDGNGNFNTPVKAILCSTGKNVGDTPLGNFSTLISYKWLRMVDNSYGQYAYRFYGSILFHSVPYYTQDKSNLEWEQFNKLGEPASLGCVRVCVADAIWLINNCPVGTAVEVYDDADNPGPLGKPEMIKIPADSPYRGWDPTDPDKNNPWNNCSPQIKTDKTTAVIYTHSTESIADLLGIKGYDTCGNDVTEKVKIEGLDVHKTGTYTVKLNLTDAIGRQAEEVIVTVEVKNKEIITTEKPTENPTEEPTTIEPVIDENKPDEEGEPEPDEKENTDNTSEKESDSTQETENTEPQSTTPQGTKPQETEQESTTPQGAVSQNGSKK